MCSMCSLAEDSFRNANMLLAQAQNVSTIHPILFNISAWTKVADSLPCQRQSNEGGYKGCKYNFVRFL